MFSADQDKRFYSGYGFTIYDQYFNGSESDVAIYRGPLMAEDEARTESLHEGGTESTQEERDVGGWLQLSIGGGGGSHVGITPNRTSQEDPQRDGPGLVELELLPSNSKAHTQPRPDLRPVTNFPSTSIGFSSLFLSQSPGNSSTSNFQRQEEINWVLRPVIPINTTIASSSFSTSMASGSYFSTRPPFQIYGPRPGLDFRVIPPPRRPHSGIWFMLQASQNIERELSLPQISKSYLRIKDGKMTIRLVIKYLVNKLSLENEYEIEVTCKGQRLEPYLTLQHVRDNIWSSTSRDSYVTLLPNSSTLDHIMVLHYARTPFNS